jgi:hypothetical protein
MFWPWLGNDLVYNLTEIDSSRRVLRSFRQGAVPGRADLRARRLCADFATGRMHCRDGERHRGLLPTSADYRPCRRRQPPLSNRAQSERPQGDDGSGAPQRAVGAFQGF